MDYFVSEHVGHGAGLLGTLAVHMDPYEAWNETTHVAIRFQLSSCQAQIQDCIWSPGQQILQLLAAELAPVWPPYT